MVESHQIEDHNRTVCREGTHPKSLDEPNPYKSQKKIISGLCCCATSNNLSLLKQYFSITSFPESNLHAKERLWVML